MEGKREFCSICKASFEIRGNRHFTYSEAGTESSVSACPDCLRQLGRPAVISELKKSYLIRCKIKGVLSSIRGPAI